MSRRQNPINKVLRKKYVREHRSRIAKNLRYLREKTGLTVDELGTQLPYSPKALAIYENPNQEGGIPGYMLIYLADFYQEELNMLVYVDIEQAEANHVARSQELPGQEQQVAAERVEQPNGVGYQTNLFEAHQYEPGKVKAQDILAALNTHNKAIQELAERLENVEQNQRNAVMLQLRQSLTQIYREIPAEVREGQAGQRLMALLRDVDTTLMAEVEQ